MSAALAERDTTPRVRHSQQRLSAHVRRVSAYEPPYDPCDDEAPRLSLVPPLAEPLPFERPARARGPAPDEFWGPQPTRRGDLPDPAPLARRFIQATLEVLAARRSARQLQQWTSPAVFSDLAKVGQRAASRAPAAAPVVRSVRVSEPADGVAEVCAVVRRGSRYHAVAARFEGVDGRWRCVQLQIG